MTKITVMTIQYNMSPEEAKMLLYLLKQHKEEDLLAPKVISDFRDEKIKSLTKILKESKK